VEPVVVDKQTTVAPTRHRVGHNGLHVLRHHPDIGGVVASSVAEAVDTDPVVEPPERHDIFLEADVGTVAAATESLTAPAAESAAAESLTAPAETPAGPAEVGDMGLRQLRTRWG